MTPLLSSCKTGNLRPWWQLSGFTRVRRTDVFWRKVGKTVAANACWPWLNGRNGAGYGVQIWHGKRMYAHRVAWELYNGCPVPAGLVVRHLCGNQLCCRPTHLALGLPRDNSRDMVEQGRHRNKVLNHAAVCEIRRLAGHVRNVDLAAQFGVTQHTLWQIVTRRTYRHIPEVV